MTDTMPPNPYVDHLSRFRDECLERCSGGELAGAQMLAAYDRFCRRYNIVHRKIRTYELSRELASVGVASEKRANPNAQPIYSGWRLTTEVERPMRRARRSEHGEGDHGSVSERRNNGRGARK